MSEETITIPKRKLMIYKWLTIAWWIVLLIFGLSVIYVYNNLDKFVTCPPCPCINLPTKQPIVTKGIVPRV
jgi:hypothetical protein